MYRLLSLLLSVGLLFSCAAAERKDIKASEIIGLLKKGKDVRLVDRVVWDDLNFTELENLAIVTPSQLQNRVESNIFFANCVFMSKVGSNGVKESLPIFTRFGGNLTFYECDFRGEVDFSHAVVFGMVNFSKSVFRANACFDQLTAWTKESYFSEMKAEKGFSMVYAAFEGNLYFLDAEFNQRTSFQETAVDGKLSFNNAVFKDRAGFDLMSVEGAAFFNYATFEGGADFSFSRFLHTTDFIHTGFGGKGNFEKTFFLNTVRFEGVDTANDLVTTGAFFGNGKSD